MPSFQRQLYLERTKPISDIKVMLATPLYTYCQVTHGQNLSSRREQLREFYQKW